MSGFVTIFGYRPGAPVVDPAELIAVRESMRNRGPDDSGEWYSHDRRIGCGHRQLAVQGPSLNGQQPMTTERYVVNFDGALYNYQHLRTMLEREGTVFNSESDAEIIPHLFARRGLDMLQMLRGVFAFTLIDVETRRMLVARDPYGVKPLYVTDDGQTLRIASQVSALVAGGRVSTDVEPAAAAGFFLMGHIPEPFTFRREIRAVSAGHFVWVDETGPSQPRRYFSVADAYARAQTEGVHTWEQDEAIEELRHATRNSIRHHFPADVPVGLFLSPDIDSAVIAALATDVGSTPLQTFTLAFGDYSDQHLADAGLAEAVARRYGTNHTSRVITRQEFIDEIPRFFAAMDQPTIGGISTYFMSKCASEAGIDVVLSGLGGTQLFGSDSSLQWIPAAVAATWLPSRVPGVARAFRKAADALAPSRAALQGLLEFGGSYAGAYFLRRSLFMPWELASMLGADFAAEGLERLALLPAIARHLDPHPGTAHARIAALDSSLYLRDRLLRDSDWASTAHSVEVRLPLVDAFLLRQLAPLLLATRSGSRELFASTAVPALPSEVLHRGRSTLLDPWREWISGGGHAAEPWTRRWARLVWGHVSNQ